MTSPAFAAKIFLSFTRSKERISVIKMAMTVRNNAAANRALAQSNKNEKARGKALAKVASGMKINSAADDASSYTIGSRMRVKLRALEQDTQNVQNGSSILRTAEGGIQGQIDIIRTIRAKVIDAANDHNTEEDRQTIQKELRHLYDQMENIAYQTDYNSKKPLLADKVIKYSELGSEEVNRTKLNLIADAEYDVLDKVRGPFAAFDEYSSSIETLGTTQGYVAGSPKIMSMDFSSFTSAADLLNTGVTVGSRTYIFTDDTSQNYRGSYITKVSINGAGSVADAMNALASKISGATVDGTKINIPTSNITAANGAGGSDPTYSTVTKTVTRTGVSGTTSGGVTNRSGDTDLAPAAPATLTVDLSGAPNDSGFRFSITKFRIVDSPSAAVEGSYDVILVKDQSSRDGIASPFRYTFDGTNLTFTSLNDGAEYNGYSIVDGYTYSARGDQNGTIDYTAYTGFSGTIATENPGTSATPASWSLDLTNMDVDDFSAQFAGKTFRFSSTIYKLYDSSIAPKLEGFVEDRGSREYSRSQIDINVIRQDVANGSSLAQAVASKLRGTADGDTVKFTSTYNGETIRLETETLRHYDIDFSNLKASIPKDLYGKGFRVYCATDNKEWFNFVFTDGTNSYDSDLENIKPINIDVSRVTNVRDLLQTIYDQGNALLTGDNQKLNHHLRLAADLDNNTLTVYDHRRFNVNKEPYDYQERGAKIADGVSFKEEEELPRDVYVRDLVIQHTDRADMNIHIQIPQMTLDQIFYPLPDTGKTIFDYPVTSKDSRDALLGSPPPGILDIGLKYLLDAATDVGAQNRRLEFTAQNISTETENVTAAESTITDADMAKEMTEYTKQNVLAQAAQTILAQANQNQSQALALLGG